MLRPLVHALAVVATLLPALAWAQSGTLTFLHVNDVYEIAPVKGRGGMAELMTLLKRERERNPAAITTLGGDFLSPSLMSGTTKGAQMVDMFNAIGTDAAVFGNHEFDFGADVARERIGESRFVWLGTNVLGKDGKPFGGSIATWTKQAGELKVGFFGVLTPLTAKLSSPGDGVAFTDVKPAAEAAIKQLKAEGAHVIVALTHLDIAEDRQLAYDVKGIDLILGGHDHDPISFYEGSTLILKAGYDAHFLGVIDLKVSTKATDKGPGTTVEPTEWRLVTTAGVAPDAEVAARVKGYTDRLDNDLNVIIGKTLTDLDSRKEAVRTREATMGNLITDALRETLKADAAITNGGGLRGDALYPAGSDLRRRDFFAENPFGNVGVLVEMSGADLLSVLENGVSKVEDKAGRFPQVSGVRFTYDPKLPSGTRVVEAQVGGRPLDPRATYKVATNDYLLRGGDGYQAFTRAKVVIDPSGAVLIATITMEYVAALGTVSPKVEGRIVAKP
ncbi:bifunctional metallophosphatase/5'-nucleotidase [Azospirillum sp.]|uniref:bifunctional metallophosphatase/5'-nucleotidase n=1 Tax=Azospirillum sp. TaxID=34012 RepID=UPI003D744665